jgi:gamma-glutamyltranspeptidase/glutathione hydrolase
MYLDPMGNVIKGLSTRGHLAAGVPGTVAGLALAHRRFGSLPWTDLVVYARDLARDGFIVDETLARSIAKKRELLSSYDATREVFVEPKLTAGDVLVQTDLALTLARIMREGEKGFYQGRTADLIATEMERGQGLITKADLAAYRAVFRKPMTVRYRGHEIIAAPLPSSGGVILSALFQMLERFDLPSMGYHSGSHVHLLTEAEKIVYRLRALFLGDSDFFASPWKELTHPSYIDRLAGLIDSTRVLPIRQLDAMNLNPGSGGVNESEETTHFSIVDRWGNAVANTYTLNGSFGSGVTVAGAGFLLNNEMDDFSIKPGYPNLYGLVGNEANAIEPGKRMLSSMSPTIVLKDGRLFIVAGTPGGATIPTTVCQVISNVVDFNMTLGDAVAERRVHSQYLPDKLYYETGALADPVMDALKRLGHNVTARDDIGDVHAILIENGRRNGDSKSGGGGRIYGVSDPRGKGRAIGY